MSVTGVNPAGSQSTAQGDKTKKADKPKAASNPQQPSPLLPTAADTGSDSGSGSGSGGSGSGSGSSGGSLRDRIHGLVSHVATQFNSGKTTPSGSGDSGSGSGPQTAGNVQVYEVGDGSGNPDSEGHSQAVANVVDNKTQQDKLKDSGGIDTQFFDNAKANAKFQDLQQQRQDGKITDQQYLDALTDLGASSTLDTASDHIQSVANDPNNKDRVINVSAGLDRQGVYQNVAQNLSGDPALAKVLNVDPATLDPSKPNFDPKAYQTVVDYVDKRYDDPNSAYATSLKRYQQVTKDASDKGVTVVVAAENDQDTADQLTQQGVKFQPGSALNFYAQSDNVISVAASDNHGTADTSDDTIAAFSSKGTGNNSPNPFGKFNPTVAINGVDEKSVGSPYYSAGDKENGGVDTGTSFSSPQVAALVHEMLVKDPNLTFDQIKQALQSGATDTSAGADAEGAGIIEDPNNVLANVPAA